MNTDIIIVIASMLFVVSPSIALIIFGLIYIIRSMRALIDPDYYKIQYNFESSWLKRAKRFMNYNPILSHDVRSEAIKGIVEGCVAITFAVYLLIVGMPVLVSIFEKLILII